MEVRFEQSGDDPPRGIHVVWHDGQRYYFIEYHHAMRLIAEGPLRAPQVRDLVSPDALARLEGELGR